MGPESRCGLVCSHCEYRVAQNCPTCTKMEKPFWAEQCPIKSCCEDKGHTHCGQCEKIPCDLLNQFSHDLEQGDDRKRIHLCKGWQAEELKNQLMKYVLMKPGVNTNYKEEWGWERFNVGDKLFLTFATMKDNRPIATIKLKPETGDFFRKQYPEKIIPGYYMNKEHWNTIYLDLPWTIEFLLPLVDEAYDITFKSLTKKKQSEIIADK